LGYSPMYPCCHTASRSLKLHSILIVLTHSHHQVHDVLLFRCTPYQCPQKIVEAPTCPHPPKFDYAVRHAILSSSGCHLRCHAHWCFGLLLVKWNLSASRSATHEIEFSGCLVHQSYNSTYIFLASLKTHCSSKSSYVRL